MFGLRQLCSTGADASLSRLGLSLRHGLRRKGCDFRWMGVGGGSLSWSSEKNRCLVAAAETAGGGGLGKSGRAAPTRKSSQGQ